MTKIKLCGLRRDADIVCVNELVPDYVGFVFAKNSIRYVNPQEAARLSGMLDSRIIPVGVFVDEPPEFIVSLAEQKVIKAIQLHGSEDDEYISKLRNITDCTIIKAFRVQNESDVIMANSSLADYVLLDAGRGDGKTFDWSLLNQINRPYFLAGGLDADNVKKAIKDLKPFGVDASSSLETERYKDRNKMMAFVEAVRNHEQNAGKE